MWSKPLVFLYKFIKLLYEWFDKCVIPEPSLSIFANRYKNRPYIYLNKPPPNNLNNQPPLKLEIKNRKII